MSYDNDKDRDCNEKIRLLMTTNDKFSNLQEEITALQEEIPEGA